MVTGQTTTAPGATFERARETQQLLRTAKGENKLVEVSRGLNGIHEHNPVFQGVVKEGKNGCGIKVVTCNYSCCPGLWEVHSQEVS